MIQLNSAATHIMRFLFPSRKQLDTRLFNSTDRMNVSLWKEKQDYFFCLVTDERVGEEKLAAMLSLLTGSKAKQSLGGLIQSNRLTLQIFASSYSEAFLSKLVFLTLPVQTFAWQLTSSEGRETVLVHEINWQKNIQESDLAKEDEANDDLQHSHVSARELAELVQLGMDIRKLRE